MKPLQKKSILKSWIKTKKEKEKRKSQDRKRKGYKAWKWECQSKYESTRWNGDKYKRIHLKRGENQKSKGIEATSFRALDWKREA